MGISAPAPNTGLEVQVQGNARPTVEGYRSVSNLFAKNWAVGVAPLASGTPLILSINASCTSTSAVISWSTASVASDSTVYYSTDASFGSSTNNATLVTSHSMTLAGLTPSTTYNYYIRSTAGSLTGTTGDRQFTTLQPPNTNAIWFTNISQSVAMQVSVASGAGVTWYWGDGASDTGASASHTFPSSGSYPNAVVVDPARSLLGFGANCYSNTYLVSNTILKSVSGLTNYPNLASLYLLSTYVSDISLKGCSNLTHLAALHTAPSLSTENGWLNELATAQAAGMPHCTVTPLCDGSSGCSNIYCPAIPGITNTATGSDYWNLQQLGWTITPF
jgi:hypothetical protein